MKIPFEFRDKLSLANDLMQFAAHIAAGFGALMAFLGLSSNLVNNSRSSVLNVDVNSLSLPMRMTLLMLIAAALGWGVGALVAWLSRSRNEAKGFAAYVIAIMWGGLMVGAADWLAVDPRRQILSEVMLYTIAGTGFALWVAGIHLRGARSDGPRALRIRCDALLFFTGGCGLFMVLTLLGASQ